MKTQFVALSQNLVNTFNEVECPSGYLMRDWYPLISDPNPPGVNGFSSVAFFLLHSLRILSTADYCAVVITCGDRTIHRSVVFPKDPRIGFMGSLDIQVGNIYTDHAFRRQGLAKLALERIREKFPGRRLWFFADQHNLPSMQLAKAAGFKVEGITVVRRFMGWGYSYSNLVPLSRQDYDFDLIQ